MKDCVSASSMIPSKQPATTTDGKTNAVTIAARYRFTIGCLPREPCPMREIQSRKNAQPARVGNSSPPPVMIACCHGSNAGPDATPA